MAAYADLFNQRSNSALRNKLTVAVSIAAETIRVEDVGTANHANRLTWAKGVFEHPDGATESMLWALLAANKDLTIAQIEAATDAAIQTKVDAAVDVFATGA